MTKPTRPAGYDGADDLVEIQKRVNMNQATIHVRMTPKTRDRLKKATIQLSSKLGEFCSYDQTLNEIFDVYEQLMNDV